MLHRHKDVFSLSEQDLGRTNLTKHHIVMGNEGRIKQHPRRTSLANSVEIERQVEDLLQRGIVKKSNSPCFSPEVLVTKKRWFPTILRRLHTSECGNCQGCLSDAALFEQKMVRHVGFVFSVLASPLGSS